MAGLFTLNTSKLDEGVLGGSGTGFVVGESVSAGSVTGVQGFTGSAAGSQVSTGFVAGSAGFTGVVSGSQVSAGSVSGVVGKPGEASGSSVSIGTVTGTIAVSGSVAAAQTTTGTVTGSPSLTGFASGVGVSSGSVSGDAPVPPPPPPPAPVIDSGGGRWWVPEQLTHLSGSVVGVQGAAVGVVTGTAVRTESRTGTVVSVRVSDGFAAGIGHLIIPISLSDIQRRQLENELMLIDFY